MADHAQGVPDPPVHAQAGQQAQQQQQQQDHVAPPAHAPAAEQPGQPVVQLKFSGKPSEDAEAHPLCTNDWMNAHHFIKGVKV